MGSIKKVRGVGLVEVYWRINQNPMVIRRPVNLLNISLLTIKSLLVLKKTTKALKTEWTNKMNKMWGWKRSIKYKINKCI